MMDQPNIKLSTGVVSREEHFQHLSQGNFDLLVIGGGATGAGVALDAASRGLQVVLVEKNDFASGTSSRSTKLLHGGVRYLEQAVWHLDRGQFKLVKEALEERSLLIKLAPHLCQEIGLITPLYKAWEVPYYSAGLKAYDSLAGKRRLRRSHYLGPKKSLQAFPNLKKKKLKGSVLYYDGQFDDARLNVAIALTAAEQGALVFNHCQVVGLIQNSQGKIEQAILQDRLSQKKITLRTKMVVNATGPFSDHIRHLVDPNLEPLLQVSSGVHLVLDKKFSPPDKGILIPETEDGRVLFVLPWLGHTLVGTTDNPAQVEENPRATEEEVDYILRQLQNYLEIPLAKADILATWSGLRPLVSQSQAKNTASLSRDHFLEYLPQGLLTITGGKWTTYRRMAMETVNLAIVKGGLSPERGSQTHQIPLVGGQSLDPDQIQHLIQKHGLAPDIAEHLHHAYGSQVNLLLPLLETGYRERLHPKHPFIQAEILHVVRHEMALTLVDILARRLRLAFLDQTAALETASQALKLVAQTLKWDEKRQEEELKDLKKYLHLSTSNAP